MLLGGKGISEKRKGEFAFPFLTGGRKTPLCRWKHPSEEGSEAKSWLDLGGGGGVSRKRASLIAQFDKRFGARIAREMRSKRQLK